MSGITNAVIGQVGDAKVQETADDAALSKMCVCARLLRWFSPTPSLSHSSPPSLFEHRSAVRLGYVNDPFISYFVRKPQRRSPLINRGT
jgi:hypothetical protein